MLVITPFDGKRIFLRFWISTDRQADTQAHTQRNGQAPAIGEFCRFA